MALPAESNGKIISYLLASAALITSTAAFAQPLTPTAPETAQAAAPTSEPQPQAAPPAPASQPAPAAEAAPKINLADQAPPPPPPVARTDKTHDGFYARVNLGFGSQHTSIDVGGSVPNFTGSDGALDVGVLIGGAPSPGIILGGALSLDTMRSTSLEADGGLQLKTSTTLAMLGPFIDGYPNPRGGFHLGGTVGLASLQLSNESEVGTNRTGGFGLAAWLGYDWWVADQWSVGGMLQFSGAHTSRNLEGADVALDTRSIALLLTAVYQ